MNNMISVTQALSILKANPMKASKQKIPFALSLGRIAAQALVADRDFPPFDRVMMDGIAINHDVYASGTRSFKIESVAQAGSPKCQLIDSNHCIEVMTGSILPAGVDTVIKYEELRIEDGVAIVESPKMSKGQNVHPQGSDRKQGDVIVEKGNRIGPAEIGIAATVGASKVEVLEWPKVVVVSTGDELIEVDKTPKTHEIRRSNVYTIVAFLSKLGLEADSRHINDVEEEVQRSIGEMLKEYDVILLIGGSSKGKFDFVPAALEQQGVTKLFYKVKQRPGKPFWFGTLNGQKFVFALPGNPVSSYLCAQRYFTYWFFESLGLQSQLSTAILKTDYEFMPALTYFLQVTLEYEEGRIFAVPVPGRGSGDLANLTNAGAFIILPDNKSIFKAGEAFPFVSF